MNFDFLVNEWTSAWNSHDLERILSHYSEEAELISPFVARLLGGSDGTVRGRAALRDYFSRGLAAYPDLKFELIQFYPGMKSCVVEYRSVNNLLAAETMEFDETGKIHRVLAHYSPLPSGS